MQIIFYHNMNLAKLCYFNHYFLILFYIFSLLWLLLRDRDLEEEEDDLFNLSFPEFETDSLYPEELESMEFFFFLLKKKKVRMVFNKIFLNFLL